jgi:hypothetical protein
MRRAWELFAALAILCACGGSGGDATRHASAASGEARRGETSAVVGVDTGATKGACPATGRWALCSVMERLDRAGLAPRRDSTDAEVRLAPLTPVGTRLRVGAAELDVFLYGDAPAREKDEARLDKSKFIEAAADPTLRGEATLIRNGNLLAILRSRSNHQRERVSDAITAGPPQTPSAAPIAGSKSRG